MDPTSDNLVQQVRSLEGKVKTFLNQTLKDICKAEGLQISGVKAALQGRIIGRLRDLADTGDTTGFETLKDKILDASGNGNSSSNPNGYGANYANHAKPQGYNYPNVDSYWPANSAHRYYSSPNSSYMPSNSSNRSAISFKSNPFYKIIEPLSGIVELPVMMNNRNSGTAKFRIDHQQMERLRTHKNTRVMIFCCIDPGTNQHAVDIAFPSQVEVKINKSPYSGSLRGIKKKSGTTRPADITEYMRTSGGVEQEVIVTYAATEKKFVFLTQLVRKYSVEELVKQVKDQGYITKNAVIDEMISKAKDPDIETTSSVMSLKCPLSTMRMKLPCRSTICKHNQCFDVTSFIQVNEQAPQWSCPICSKVFGFANLAIDQYVQDILQSTSTSVDQVTVEPDGSWRAGNHVDEAPARTNGSSKRSHAEYLDDDDLFEITDFRPKEHAGGVSLGQPPQMMTPTGSSREASTTASSAPWSSHSKKTTEVIDLTLDSEDDDDDEPIRPPPIKRQSMGTGIYNSSLYSQPQHSTYPSYPERQNQPQSQPLPQRTGPPISFNMPSKPSIDNQHNSSFLTPPPPFGWGGSYR